MDAKAILQQSFNLAHFATQMMLGDLSDADLLVRAVPGMNHAAWQLGHLISSEHDLMNAVKPAYMPPLPAHFAENHSAKNSKSDDASQFLGKAEYLRLLDEQRQATLKLLDTLTPVDLDKPTPEHFQSYAPNVGAMFVLVASHETMHLSQVTAVRRKLGKPVAF